MINYLDFDQPCLPNMLPRIGGGANLPAETPWPQDDDGMPMLHLMTLPASFVNTYSTIKLQEGQGVTVFIPYKKDSVDHAIALARNTKAAHVVVHQLVDNIRNEAEFPLEPPHEISVDCDTDAEDEDEFSDEIDSKIGGRATWLQDRIECPGNTFLLQLLGSEFNEYWPMHKGMFLGGVLYLFLDDQLKSGQLTLQYT